MFQRNYIFNMFQSTDIPFDQFQKLGKSKDNILGLPNTELQALLSGRPTRLMDIKSAGAETTKAKLSIYRGHDGSADIKVHPVREALQIPPEFTSYQKKVLQEGKPLLIEEMAANRSQRFLCQVDLQTNEMYKISLSNIQIPHKIDGNPIQDYQKSLLKEGKPVIFYNSKNQRQEIQIDLISHKGYQSIDQKLNPQEENQNRMEAKNEQKHSFKRNR